MANKKIKYPTVSTSIRLTSEALRHNHNSDNVYVSPNSYAFELSSPIKLETSRSIYRKYTNNTGYGKDIISKLLHRICILEMVPSRISESINLLMLLAEIMVDSLNDKYIKIDDSRYSELELINNWDVDSKDHFERAISDNAYGSIKYKVTKVPNIKIKKKSFKSFIEHTYKLDYNENFIKFFGIQQLVGTPADYIHNRKLIKTAYEYAKVNPKAIVENLNLGKFDYSMCINRNGNRTIVRQEYVSEKLDPKIVANIKTDKDLVLKYVQTLLVCTEILTRYLNYCAYGNKHAISSVTRHVNLSSDTLNGESGFNLANYTVGTAAISLTVDV